MIMLAFGLIGFSLWPYRQLLFTSETWSFRGSYSIHSLQFSDRFPIRPSTLRSEQSQIRETIVVFETSQKIECYSEPFICFLQRFVVLDWLKSPGFYYPYLVSACRRLVPEYQNPVMYRPLCSPQLVKESVYLAYSLQAPL